MKRLFAMIATLVFSSCCHSPPARPEPPALVVAITPEGATPTRVGTVTFDLPIDDYTVDALEASLLALSDADVIVLVLDTPGGYVAPARRAARAIETSATPIICLVDGNAMSAGFYILQSCAVRLMTPRSVLMAHEARVAIQGEPNDAKDQIAGLDAVNMAMAWQNCRRLTIPIETCVASYRGHDWFIPAGQALLIGAIDDLVPTVQETISGLAAVVRD